MRLAKASSKEHIAFNCIECGTINVFPNNKGDGNRCMECGGCIVPIGNARVYERPNNIINIGVKVDTAQLDAALDEAKELTKTLEQAEELFKIFCEYNCIPPINLK